MHIFALFFLENELRTLNSTRYLHTAKRGNDGKLIYLIDGLDMNGYIPKPVSVKNIADALARIEEEEL